ncbi:hypothetical protein HPP92_011107 [Vanilla planifolia]|uniref:Uncharacterized protein n=1 Tax=Vanilla planifolia TaxID=51239 RepID=A0A835V364_VANPL|nr:hypothetical protein HPP92_011107 [Vanilla planifolia]
MRPNATWKVAFTSSLTSVEFPTMGRRVRSQSRWWRRGYGSGDAVAVWREGDDRHRYHGS